ncbi:hypothetical protein [Gordonia oryzae]|uniref:hypothetical protein n=1 Tax=Gordonia oryzae TaxID=2487349 RepID=UPI001614C724|nr:hypothetical protein [Gordonia oryzae]
MSQCSGSAACTLAGAGTKVFGPDIDPPHERGTADEIGITRRRSRLCDVDAIAVTARDLPSRAASIDTDSASVALPMVIEIVVSKWKYRPYFTAAR